MEDGERACVEWVWTGICFLGGEGRDQIGRMYMKKQQRAACCHRMQAILSHTDNQLTIHFRSWQQTHGQTQHTHAQIYTHIRTHTHTQSHIHTHIHTIWLRSVEIREPISCLVLTVRIRKPNIEGINSCCHGDGCQGNGMSEWWWWKAQTNTSSCKGESNIQYSIIHGQSV